MEAAWVCKKKTVGRRRETTIKKKVMGRKETQCECGKKGRIRQQPSGRQEQGRGSEDRRRREWGSVKDIADSWKSEARIRSEKKNGGVEWKRPKGKEKESTEKQKMKKKHTDGTGVAREK